MKTKKSIATVLVVGSCGAILGWRSLGAGRHRPKVKRSSAAYTRTIAGYDVQLVAIGEPVFSSEIRRADHSWTPDGAVYEGSERRLWNNNGRIAPQGANRCDVTFEVREWHPTAPSTSPALLPDQGKVDVYAYLPKNGGSADGDNSGAAGPITIQPWHGVPKDSGGSPILSSPSSLDIQFGADSKNSQPVVFGIARGAFKTIGKGAISVTPISEGDSEVVASGPWGRLEVAHLTPPRVQSRPSPTHRFTLLGGTFPPSTEKKAFFYDSKGTLLASCGDGPDNSGFTYPWLASGRRFVGVSDIASYEIQERPYQFSTFDDVDFEAPSFASLTGAQGLDKSVDSPLGKIIGVLKGEDDGSWEGSSLFAANGARWRDPGMPLAGYEYGMFNPWNHQENDQLSILFEPKPGSSLIANPVKTQVFSADSPDGPDREQLTSWDEFPFQTPMTSIGFKPTTRPYVRLEISPGGGTWQTIENIPVTDQMLQRAATASPGSHILEVFLYSTGEIKTRKDEINFVPSKATWNPAKQSIHAIAHLRNGQTIEANLNMGGGGGPKGLENHFTGMSYTKQMNGTLVQSGAKWVDIKEVSSFDIQVQNLRKPVAITFHSPMND